MGKIYHILAEVIESQPLGKDYQRLLLRMPRIASAARPGQFLHCAPGHLDEALALLRRPLSMSDIVSDSNSGAPGCIELVFRMLGSGTRLLAARKPGDMVDCLGPLGNGFSLAPEKISLVIAGGMGIVPLRWLAKELARQGSSVYLLAGGKSADDMPFTVEQHTDRKIFPEFEAAGVHSEFVSDEDGLLVTDLLAKRLPALLALGKPIQAYAVGPRAMFRALASALPPEVPCQVSLEERMACGVGACRSCVVALHHPQPPGYVYRRVCKDGPVFSIHDIVWDVEKDIV